MADADPSLAASPASHVAAADAAPVTAHPVRKFKHALIALAKFWPFWVLLILAGVLFVVADRALKGVVIRHTPILGPWALRRALNAPAATVVTSAAPAAAPAEDTGEPPY